MALGRVRVRVSTTARPKPERAKNRAILEGELNRKNHGVVGVRVRVSTRASSGRIHRCHRCIPRLTQMLGLNLKAPTLPSEARASLYGAKHSSITLPPENKTTQNGKNKPTKPQLPHCRSCRKRKIFKHVAVRKAFLETCPPAGASF